MITNIENNDLDNIYEVNSIDDIYSNNMNNNNMDIIPINYFKNNCLDNICEDNYIIKDFSIIYDIIQSLNLDNFQKNLILVRFRRINIYCIKNYKSISNYYTKSKLFIIICGILNPSLLSINNNQEEKFYTLLFWTVWSLQLLVSLITGYVGLFKWDKKYFLFNAYKTKINQEIWRFIGLSGKNYKSEKANSYDHSYHLSVFLNRLESFYCQLKISEFEIENTKEEDSNNSDNIASNGNGKTVNVKQDAINLMKSRQNNQQLQSENNDLKVMRNEMEDENRRLQTKLRRAEREYR